MKAPFLTFLCVLFLIPSPLRASELETVRFGVILSLSGEFGRYGKIYLTGIKIGLDKFNKDAARHGYRLEMLVRDDASDPERAAEALDDLDREGVVAVIGSNASSVTLQLVEPAQEKGIVLISPSSTADALGKDSKGVFSVLFNDTFQGSALARFLRNSINVRRVAIISNARHSYSRSIIDAFSEAFSAAGGRIVASEYYDKPLESSEEFDFSPHIAKALASKPQVILLPNYAEEVTTLIRQSLEAGTNVVFCGGDSWEHESILTESGNNIANSYYIGYLDENSTTPQMREFMELLNQSNEVSAEVASSLGYDALFLLVEGLRNGHTRADLLEGMYAIRNLPLVTGDITIDRERGVLKLAYIVKIDRLGSDFSREVVDVVFP